MKQTKDKRENSIVQKPLSEAERALLAPYVGKEIVLGVRPENIAAGGDVTVHVISNENLGMNTLVHGTLADKHTQITCKLRGWCDYKRGDEVKVSFTKCHFFDKETTNAIR